MLCPTVRASALDYPTESGQARIFIDPKSWFGGRRFSQAAFIPFGDFVIRSLYDCSAPSLTARARGGIASFGRGSWGSHALAGAAEEVGRASGNKPAAGGASGSAGTGPKGGKGAGPGPQGCGKGEPRGGKTGPKGSVASKSPKRRKTDGSWGHSGQWQDWSKQKP